MSLESKKSNLIASHSDGLQSKRQQMTGTKKPEPFFVDEKSLHKLIEQQKSARHWYSELLKSYLSLDIGPGSMAILQKLQDGDLNEFKIRFFEKVENEIQRSGFTIPAILETLRTNTAAPWQAFVRSIEVNNGQIARIRAMYPDTRLDMNYFSIKNNEVMFDENDQERVRIERASVFLDSQAKQSFSMLCETILSDLKKLDTRCQENGIKILFGAGGIFTIENMAGRQVIHLNKVMINHIQL